MNLVYRPNRIFYGVILFLLGVFLGLDITWFGYFEKIFELEIILIPVSFISSLILVRSGEKELREVKGIDRKVRFPIFWTMIGVLILISVPFFAFVAFLVLGLGGMR
ncbi:MAG: hypothetical protein Q8Q05_02795 [bacterium]|nr:hypothetical protein [bacterium]